MNTLPAHFLILAALVAAALLIVIIIIGLLSRSRRQAELAVLHAERDNLNERQRQSDLQAAESARQIQTLQQHLQQTETELAAASALNRRLPELQQQLADSRSEYAELEQNARRLHGEYAAAEQQIRHLTAQAEELGRLKTDYAELQQQLAEQQIRNERLNTLLEQERQAQEEKLALLDNARDLMSGQFRHLADEILEEKSRRFTEQNREHLGRLLNPLNERISGFAQLVQNTYEKEAKERLTLENELKRLQQLNNRLHDDANALTDALTGSRNKTQGNWGEMILESVLEHSGLQRGREYIIQASGTQTQEDGHTRRLQPDVLINLPDDKQIIIDSKVSLTAYVRYTRAENEHEARQALAAHVQSVRQHIKELAEKKYSDIDGLKTLDFVFMFIPVEPAYLAALQQEPGLFQECFDKRIMLAGPGTLLATLRTVANIWRTEQQNRNALAIADEGGRLYDKFVGFVDTLQKVGRNIDQAQTAYQQAFNQLKSGHGNLVNRAQKLHRLGLKTAKQLDRQLTEEAAEAEAETSSLPAPESGETENRG